jgi:hypothetical protein
MSSADVLLSKGKALGRKTLEEVAGLVTPDTILVCPPGTLSGRATLRDTPRKVYPCVSRFRLSQQQLPLEAKGVDTVGGLMVVRLGRVPVQGDRIKLEGASAEVVEVQRHRVTRVRVTKTAEQDDRSRTT